MRRGTAFLLLAPAVGACSRHPTYWPAGPPRLDAAGRSAAKQWSAASGRAERTV